MFACGGRAKTGARHIATDFHGLVPGRSPRLLGPGGTKTGDYHVVYLSTVVRMVPVLR